MSNLKEKIENLRPSWVDLYGEVDDLDLIFYVTGKINLDIISDINDSIFSQLE
jgi:hypothetical protein